MTPAEALESASAAERRVRKAAAARVERDDAIVAAFEAGVKPPRIAKATDITLSTVRKVLRDRGVSPAAASTEET